jgi:hypothetical protein
MLKLLKSWLKAGPHGVPNDDFTAATVRLLHGNRLPVTPLEKKLAAVIVAGNEIPIAQVIDAVAAELYREELQNGAATLDIGLFGKRLFARDVTRELIAETGNYGRSNAGNTIGSDHTLEARPFTRPGCLGARSLVRR